jgi:hypothetical protein
MADKWSQGIKAGSVDVSITVILRQTTNNQESPGRLFSEVNTGGASYWRQGGTRTAITASALGSVNGAHADGGWIQVDATTMPGIYRFDIPDAAVAAGSDWVTVSILVSGCYLFVERFDLTTSTVQTQDHTTALSAIQSDTNDIQARLPAALVSGRIDASVGAMAADTITASAVAVGAIASDAFVAGAINSAAIADNAITAAKVADAAIDAATFATGAITAASLAADAGAEIADAVLDEVLSGHVGVGSLGKAIADIEVDTSTTLQGEIDGVQADTEDIQARLPAALVSGRIDASVGAMAANVVTASAIATDAIDADAIAANAIGASEIAADAGTEIAASVWNALTSGIVTAGSIGVLLKNSVPFRVSKNTALVGFPFVMYDSTTDVGKTGLAATITCQRSLDGGAYQAMTNASAEIGNGLYVIDLSAADTNANTITYRFSHATTKDTFVHIITEPPGV